MQIFVFLQPMWRQVQSCVSDSRTFQPQGSYREKNTRKNMTFWLLNSFIKRPDWKIWLWERFSKALTSKLWNKRNTCCWSSQKCSEIELCLQYSPFSLQPPSPPTPNTHHPSHGFIKNLPQLHLRDSYVRFSGKNKVDNTMWGKSCDLIGQNRQNSFQ